MKRYRDSPTRILKRKIRVPKSNLVVLLENNTFQYPKDIKQKQSLSGPVIHELICQSRIKELARHITFSGKHFDSNLHSCQVR